MKAADLRKKVAAVTSMVEDIGDLRAFAFVVDLQSITAAANILGESKATTSRRLSRLEAAVGVALIKRMSRRVQVTDIGNEYRQRIGEVLELLADANAGLRNANRVAHGKLRVTAPLELSRCLAPLVTSFAETQPLVRVEVVLAPPTRPTVDLELDGIDVAFRLGQPMFAYPHKVHELCDLRNWCVASPAYIKAHGTPRRLEDLTVHRVLTHEQNDDWTFQQDDDPAVSVRLKPYIASSDTAFITQLALEGVGIAVVPSINVRADLETGKLVRVLAHHWVRGAALYVLCRDGRYVPTKVSTFIDHAIEHLS